VKFVQVTGAGLDPAGFALSEQRGIGVANVPGGSNEAVAEYAVTRATVLLRGFLWADAEIRKGNYREFRARMITDNLQGLDGLTVGIMDWRYGRGGSLCFSEARLLDFYYGPCAAGSAYG